MEKKCVKGENGLSSWLPFLCLASFFLAQEFYDQQTIIMQNIVTRQEKNLEERFHICLP